MSPTDSHDTPDDHDSADRFSSTEPYYARYRPRYGSRTIQYLIDRFALDESSRVLDLGCGTGQIAIPLSEHVGEVVAMDPNEAMLRAGRRQAKAAGRENVEWVLGSDADLPGSVGTVRLTTMGRSFHWMDQERTLDHLYELTEPGGGVALVTDGEWLTHGRDDWQVGVHELADEYLDDLPARTGPIETYDDPWDEKLAAHGFDDVETVTVEFEREWDEDGIVGYVFSLSFCSPAVFGDRQAAFEADLRASLRDRDVERFVQHGEVEVIAGRK
ncbi:class I SAM-dependent methyltransferase [Haloarchaeobius sp. DT45]|uniref:class I SAM-dependent methyltransferase n=1 Tax=Haloarchaeobius sp. DT45 TaxID=3446116 RepID=UPI003F6BED87